MWTPHFCPMPSALLPEAALGKNAQLVVVENQESFEQETQDWREERAACLQFYGQATPETRPRGMAEGWSGQQSLRLTQTHPHYV